jgi:hypothetical protein
MKSAQGMQRSAADRHDARSDAVSPTCEHSQSNRQPSPEFSSSRLEESVSACTTAASPSPSCRLRNSHMKAVSIRNDGNGCFKLQKSRSCASSSCVWETAEPCCAESLIGAAQRHVHGRAHRGDARTGSAADSRPSAANPRRGQPRARPWQSLLRIRTATQLRACRPLLRCR